MAFIANNENIFSNFQKKLTIFLWDKLLLNDCNVCVKYFHYHLLKIKQKQNSLTNENL